MIGEAISRLSVELRERHPDVPWRQIIAVRHRIVHAYFDLDWQILWDAATEDIPELRQKSFRNPKRTELAYLDLNLKVSDRSIASPDTPRRSPSRPTTESDSAFPAAH